MNHAACPFCTLAPERILVADDLGVVFRDGFPVPDHADLVRDPLRTISLLQHYAESGLANPMAERGDIGVYAINKNAGDRGSFITPGLRGLSHTAPYMHNGRYTSLEEVVDFHDRGDGPGSELRPLRLSAHERQALVAFLQNAYAQRATQKPNDLGAIMLLVGFTGIVFLLLLFSLLGKGRKRRSVNQEVFDRQVVSE